MPLDLTRYDVAIAREGLDLDKALDAGEGDGYDVHRVTVLHADQLVAEQAAPRFAIPPLGEESTHKMTWATLWCWCALRRMAVGVPEFPAFQSRLLSVDPVKPHTDTDTEPDTEPDTDTGTGVSLDPTVSSLVTGSP